MTFKSKYPLLSLIPLHPEQNWLPPFLAADDPPSCFVILFFRTQQPCKKWDYIDIIKLLAAQLEIITLCVERWRSIEVPVTWMKNYIVYSTLEADSNVCNFGHCLTSIACEILARPIPKFIQSKSQREILIIVILSQ